MTTTEKPVLIRRTQEKILDGSHIWKVWHHEELVAQFASGTSALNYVDCELSAWYKQKRDAQAKAIQAGVAGMVRFLAKNAGKTWLS